MKKSRFTEAQIMNTLKESQNGVPVAKLCRTHGMSNATFYSWRSKYGGMDASIFGAESASRRESSAQKNVWGSSAAKRDFARGPTKKVVRASHRRGMALKAQQVIR